MIEPDQPINLPYNSNKTIPYISSISSSSSDSNESSFNPINVTPIQAIPLEITLEDLNPLGQIQSQPEDESEQGLLD